MNGYTKHTISELYANWNPDKEYYYISEHDLVLIKPKEQLEVLYDEDAITLQVAGQLYPIYRVEKIDEDLYHVSIKLENGYILPLIDDDIQYVFKMKTLKDDIEYVQSERKTNV